MSDDPLAEVFKGLSFPGKRPLRSLTPKAPVEGEAVNENWDEKPLRMMLRGQLVDLFTVGHLSVALGRQPVTVRSWEAKGWLPQTMYRAPNPRGQQVPGKASKGRRLYTREQIEIVIRAAHKFGVLTDQGRNADWKSFTRTVLAGWKTIA